MPDPQDKVTLPPTESANQNERHTPRAEKGDVKPQKIEGMRYDYGERNNRERSTPDN
jgi:hypothetical protein